MSMWSRATRPTQPAPTLKAAGERAALQPVMPTMRTAVVNPNRVQIQDSRGQGWVGNLDEIVERERARLAGEQLPAVPSARPAVPQQPGLLNLIQNIFNQGGNSATPQKPASNCDDRGRL